MNHPMLGAIEFKPGEINQGVAAIEYETRSVEIQLLSDEQPFDTCINLAADLVARLKEIDQASKKIIVSNLRAVYNAGWNEYDEVQEDGTTLSVSNPELSELEFAKKFTLIGITISGGDVIDLVYDDEGLFWGHSVIVTSLHGLDFSEAQAELVG